MKNEITSMKHHVLYMTIVIAAILLAGTIIPLTGLPQPVQASAPNAPGDVQAPPTNGTYRVQWNETGVLFNDVWFLSLNENGYHGTVMYASQNASIIAWLSPGVYTWNASVTEAGLQYNGVEGGFTLINGSVYQQVPFMWLGNYISSKAEGIPLDMEAFLNYTSDNVYLPPGANPWPYGQNYSYLLVNNTPTFFLTRGDYCNFTLTAPTGYNISAVYYNTTVYENSTPHNHNASYVFGTLGIHSWFGMFYFGGDYNNVNAYITIVFAPQVQHHSEPFPWSLLIGGLLLAIAVIAIVGYFKKKGKEPEAKVNDVNNDLAGGENPSWKKQ